MEQLSPKEKANELIEKYTFYTLVDFSDENYNRTVDCALIAVEEIINELKNEVWFSNCEDNNIDKRFNYWQEVKEELIKLKQ